MKLIQLISLGPPEYFSIIVFCTCGVIFLSRREIDKFRIKKRANDQANIRNLVESLVSVSRLKTVTFGSSNKPIIKMENVRKRAELLAHMDIIIKSGLFSEEDKYTPSSRFFEEIEWVIPFVQLHGLKVAKQKLKQFKSNSRRGV